MTTSAKDQEKSPLPQKRHSFEKKVKIDLNLNSTDLDKNDCCGSKELEKPPDGGWGWMIVFASLICNVVFGKLILCMRILLLPTKILVREINVIFFILSIFN